MSDDKTTRRAASFAIAYGSAFYPDMDVTQTPPPGFRVNLFTHWEESEDEPWLLMTNLRDKKKLAGLYKKRFWIEEMFSDHKSRGLNLERSRVTDPDRLQRLLVAVSLAYLWVMEIGAVVVARGEWKRVDNKGKDRSVSLCQIGLRWLTECWNNGEIPPLLSFQFNQLPA